MQIDKHLVPELTEEQKVLLSEVRVRRGFDVDLYVKTKVKVLSEYLTHCGIRAVVVALSGGVDSAVVAALLAETAKVMDLRVVGVSLPSTDNRGVVDQDSGCFLSYKCAEKIGIEWHGMDVNFAVKMIGDDVHYFLNHRNASDWAYGQLTPYTRTPYLYYVTTVLKDSGYPAVLVGTTNRDEGAYLGYVGKASDGMVDIQLISDLHKSEVYQVARKLNVPEEIINAVPKGDMYNASTDEEIFGARYDLVELFLNNQNVTGEGIDNLKELHRYNAHKYRVGSPALHMDIYESGTPGGWALQFESKYWDLLDKIFPLQIDIDNNRKLRDLFKDVISGKKLVYIDGALLRFVGLCSNYQCLYVQKWGYIVKSNFDNSNRVYEEIKFHA